MNEQADATDAKLDAYTFELNDEWDGPGDYGFALAGPDLREGFGEVSVDEAITVTLAGVPIDSAEPGNAFPEEVIVGLFEVLVPNEPAMQEFVEQQGIDAIRTIFSRHVDRLRESLIVAVHAAVAGACGSA